VPRHLRVTLLLIAAIALAGCGSSKATGPHTAVGGAPGVPPCPTSAQWESARPTPWPTGKDGTPIGNTPQAEALSQALGDQGRGAYADIYGSQVTDYPMGHVALCVTDLTRGHAMAEAAKKAHPDTDLARLDLYTCRYSQRTLDDAAKRLAPLMPTVLGYPVYNYGPAMDASGLQVMTDARGAASQALHDRLATAVGDGIPVTLRVGQPEAAY
jgi:hypothetical protein